MKHFQTIALCIILICLSSCAKENTASSTSETPYLEGGWVLTAFKESDGSITSYYDAVSEYYVFTSTTVAYHFLDSRGERKVTFRDGTLTLNGLTLGAEPSAGWKMVDNTIYIDGAFLGKVRKISNDKIVLNEDETFERVKKIVK